jgi:hypothetical protein
MTVARPIANSLLKNAVVAFFNLAKCGAKLRTARNPSNSSTDGLLGSGSRRHARLGIGIAWLKRFVARGQVHADRGQHQDHDEPGPPILVKSLFLGRVMVILMAVVFVFVVRHGSMDPEVGARNMARHQCTTT